MINRLSCRQYPSSPYLEQAYASWALRQTASGGLSLVLPPAVLGEEDEEEEEDEDGAGGVHLSADEEGEAAAEQDGPAPPLGSHHHEEHLRRGEALESAIDEIQAYMSKRASQVWYDRHTYTDIYIHTNKSLTHKSTHTQVWSRSASLAEMAAASGGTGGRTSLSPVPLPVDKRVIGAGTVAVPSGVEGGGGGRDSLALRASLLAGAAGRAAVPTTTSTSGSKLWLARQRWLWAVGDYALGLFVFVLLSVTWWRGAWNLFDFYVFPRRRGLRIVTLIAGGAAANAAAFLLYGPTRAWGRRMHRPTEAWVYGTVKRLLVLVRMVASVANWTGCWGLLDAAVRGAWHAWERACVRACCVRLPFLLLLPPPPSFY